MANTTKTGITYNLWLLSTPGLAMYVKSELFTLTVLIMLLICTYAAHMLSMLYVCTYFVFSIAYIWSMLYNRLLLIGGFASARHPCMHECTLLGFQGKILRYVCFTVLSWDI